MDKAITAWKYYSKMRFQLVPVSLKLNKGKKITNLPKWENKEYTLKEFKENIKHRSGIAIKTGLISNLFVIDIDSGGLETLKAGGIEDKDIKNIPQVETQGNGLHLYFQFPSLLAKKIKLTRSKRKAGIDLRGNGGLIFAPPTKVKHGGKYKWKKGTFKTPLPKMPKKIEKFLLTLFTSKQEENFTNENSKSISQKQQEIWKKTIKKFLLDYKDTEDRSSLDYYLTATGYEFSVDPEEIIRVLLLPKGSKSKEKGQQYIENLLQVAKANLVSHLEKLIIKISKTPPEEKDLLTNQVYLLLSKLPPNKQEIMIRKLQQALNNVPLKVIRYNINQAGKEDEIYNKFITISNSGYEQFVPKMMGEYILKDTTYLCLSGVLYRYEKGVYKKDGLEFLVKQIHELLGYKWLKKYRDEVIAWIKDYSSTTIDKINNSDLINVENGMYNIKENKLLEHNPKYNSLVQLKVKYNPKAKCKRLDTFIKEVFPMDTISLVWEYTGYILLSDLELKKFLILFGESDSGKSKWLSLIQHIIGEENVSNESLHRLAERPFSVANLFGKIANIYADLEISTLKGVSFIKLLTGGDKINAEIKHGSTFYFYNKARMLFSTNELPQIQNYDKAFFDRIMVIKCSNKFVLGKNADPYILKKLCTEDGKSTWLNNAIKGAKILLKKQKFSSPKSVRKELNKYRLTTDSVSEFVETQLEKMKNSWETKETVYSAYINWCREVGRKPVAVRKFTQRALKSPLNLKECYPRSKEEHRQVMAWKDISLSENCQAKYEDLDIN